MQHQKFVRWSGNRREAPQPVEPPTAPAPQQQVEPPPPPQQQQQQDQTAAQQVEPPPVSQQVEPSAAAQHQVKEMGYEEQIVRHFYQTTKKSGEGSQNSEEISMFKYIIKNPVHNSWANGELSIYSSFHRKWGNKIDVKFYIITDLKKEEAAEISRKADDLLPMQSYTNVFIPIFQVYSEGEKRLLLCYPDFDLHLGDWLQSNTEDTLQSAEEDLLQPTWINFIRDILSCIEPIDKMAISKFGDLSSYVWKRESKCIKIILFPVATQTIGVQNALLQFADLLMNHVRSHWLHPELQFQLDSFITFLKQPAGSRQFWGNLADHTLLQDYEGISSLIAMTWRPKLTKDQINALKLNISYPEGHISWREVPITDPVMAHMCSEKFSNDVRGLFAYIKDLAAHYPENYRKYYWKSGHKGPNGQQHLVSLIKGTYPRAISEIYMLSKYDRWLQ